MKRIGLLLLTLIFVAVLSPAWGQDQPGTGAPVEVFFSPAGGCTEAVVGEVAKAKTSVVVQAYRFTSVPIAKALLDAHKRGVNVRVILDRSQRGEKYSSADFLQHSGIATYIDAKHAIAHNKVMVIDNQVVITGSFNFTKQAETSNTENLLVIRDSKIAGKYSANWKSHLEHSEVYEAKEKGFSETTRPSTPAASGDPARSSPAKTYVASRNSPLFHDPDCVSAGNITEKNLVKYASRDEAIRAGKRP